MEKKIEAKLRRRVEDLGGLCLKFTSPAFDGVPDRIILSPTGKVCFVEAKSEGQNLRPLQEKRKKQFEALGFKVYVLITIEDMEEIINDIF